MTNNDEVTHMAQVICANDLAIDLEAVQAEWAEYSQASYMYEASKLLQFMDAVDAYRAARAPHPITGAVDPAAGRRPANGIAGMAWTD